MPVQLQFLSKHLVAVNALLLILIRVCLVDVLLQLSLVQVCAITQSTVGEIVEQRFNLMLRVHVEMQLTIIN